MATRNIAYAASANLTCTIASLASDTNLVIGRVATQSDNSSNKYLDSLLSAKITTGTTPTAGVIEIWVIPELDDTNRPDGISATDAAYTATSRDILTGEGVLAWSINTDTTSNRTYYMRKTSIAGLFGGTFPRKYSVFVVHSTVAVLHATAGNHQLTEEGITETIA